ncbi:MAG: cytochrome c biogenesis protein CcdA [bacterium]|nr:cytochrome c biogenesis protein CcdA [bacterium]
MDIIFSASIIAAFLAGMVALFAPCCITVLLPAYLGSAFREKRNILKMTFIFFAGISVVLIPIGLGAAGLAQVFQDFHKELYIFGGLFMLLLAVMSLLGKGIFLPLPGRMRSKLKLSNARSVFMLGVLSGAATSCCAPVLAGAMTLAVISGAFWKAIIVVFAYIFGMTFPLFITAYLYDKYKIEESAIIRGKLLEVKIGTKIFYAHSTNLVSSVIFLIIGMTMLVLGLSGNAFWSPDAQAGVGRSLNAWTQYAFELLSVIPDAVWAIIIIGIFLFFLFRAEKKFHS